MSTVASGVLSGHRLIERDELTFLLGSWYVESAEAILRRQKPRVPPARFLQLIGAAKAGRELTDGELSALSGMKTGDIANDLGRKFDAARKAESQSYAIGVSMLSARTSLGGWVAANMALMRIHEAAARKTAKKPKAEIVKPRPARPAPELPPPAGLDEWKEDQSAEVAQLVELEAYDARQSPAGEEPARTAKAVKSTKLARGEDQIEPWDLDGEPRSWSSEVATEQGIDAEGLQAPDFLIDDDLAGEPLGPAAGAEASPHLDPAAARAAVDWLTGLGANNSGVSIEPYAGRLIGKLTPAGLARVSEALVEGQRDRRIVQTLERGLLGKKLTLSETRYLRRLSAVLRCIEEGYRLPARRALPEYDPVPGSVLYLLHMRDPYEVNGYVSRTHLLLASMKAAGFDPIAVTRLGFPSDLARHRKAVIAKEEVLEGVTFVSLADVNDGQNGHPVDEYIDAYAQRIVELALKYRPAIIQAASNHLNGLAAIKAARLLGIPAVYEVRGIWEITQASANVAYASSLRYELQRRLENVSVSAADKVITISEPLRRFVVEHGAKDANVSVVPNGVDVNHMRPVRRDSAVMALYGLREDEVIVGYVGSIVHYEGLDYVIEAVRRLKDKGVAGFRLLVVGDGRELPNLRALAERLGVADLCLFPGRVPRDKVEALYSVIDIVPLPRRSLPVTELVPPLKPFEAMAAGKAVIVSSVEAIAGTVVDGKTGLIVEKDNVAALAEALERLIVDPALRKKVGETSREWVAEERSVAYLARGLAAVYASAGVAAKTGGKAKSKRPRKPTARPAG